MIDNDDDGDGDDEDWWWVWVWWWWLIMMTTTTISKSSYCSGSDKYHIFAICQFIDLSNNKQSTQGHLSSLMINLTLLFTSSYAVV